MPVTTIPLVNPQTQRGLNARAALSAGKDARLVNGYVYSTPNPFTQERVLYIEKRPGWERVSTPNSGVGGADALSVNFIDGNALSVFTDGKVFLDITQVGSTGLDSTTFPSTLAIFSGGAYALMNDDGQAYFLQNSMGASVTAIAGGYPSSVEGSIWEMDGFAFVMEKGDPVVRNSALNDITTWPASNAFSVNQYAGASSGCIRYGQFILAFTTRHVEFLRNTGNAFGSVLSREVGLTQLIGAFSGYSITNFNNTVAWISSNSAAFNTSNPRISPAAVYVMDGVTPKKISDAFVDSILASMAKVDGSSWAKLIGYQLLGRHFLYLVVGEREDTPLFPPLIYDSESGMWSEAGFTYVMIPSRMGRPIAVSRESTGGFLYSQDTDNPPFTPVYEDYNDQAYSLICQTQPYYLNNGLPFIIDNINLLADTQSSGSTTLATTADDYANFVTVGSFDLTQQQKNLPCGGYYDSSVAFRVTDSGNNAWRGQALQVTWRPAT